MGKQDNAGRFERGYLKVTIENLTSWTLTGCEKPPDTINRGALNITSPRTLENICCNAKPNKQRSDFSNKVYVKSDYTTAFKNAINDLFHDFVHKIRSSRSTVERTDQNSCSIVGLFFRPASFSCCDRIPFQHRLLRCPVLEETELFIKNRKPIVPYLYHSSFAIL